VRQRIGACDQWTDTTLLDVVHDIVEDYVFLEGAAVEGQILEVERAYIQLHKRAGDRAGSYVSTPSAQKLDQLRPLFADDEINGHAHAVGSKRLDKIVPARHDVIGTQCFDLVGFAGAG